VNTEEINPHLTTKIVVSYVRHHRLVPDQLADLIISVNRAISQLGQPLEPEAVLTPAVSIRRSVNQNHVTCLDCGYRGKTLRRHIATRHGLSPGEYRQRWGLRSNHLLTAPAYSERRSTLAKARGFGRKLVASAKTPKASPAAMDVAGNPKTKRSRARPALKSTLVSEAAPSTPATRRRPRARAASPSA
jgi:predicted transcriptional regulator